MELKGNGGHHNTYTEINIANVENVNPNVIEINNSICVDTKNKSIMNDEELIKRCKELENQHHEDTLMLECINEELKFYKEFWGYIADKAIGNKLSIIEAVVNNEHNSFEGYVKVKKHITEKQEVLLDFVTPKGDKYTAKWQPSDNYGCWQTSEWGDDYSGYMLFPTYRNDEYFCIWYKC